jgi:hypothetical protein
VPINGSQKADNVNFFHYQLVAKDKVTCQTSWVTDLPVVADHVAEMFRAGRCSSKIEHEPFNTLKNRDYHIEHNLSHGNNHLSMVFFYPEPTGLLRPPGPGVE